MNSCITTEYLPFHSSLVFYMFVVTPPIGNVFWCFQDDPWLLHKDYLDVSNSQIFKHPL